MVGDVTGATRAVRNSTEECDMEDARCCLRQLLSEIHVLDILPERSQVPVVDSSLLVRTVLDGFHNFPALIPKFCLGVYVLKHCGSRLSWTPQLGS